MQHILICTRGTQCRSIMIETYLRAYARQPARGSHMGKGKEGERRGRCHASNLLRGPRPPSSTAQYWLQPRFHICAVRVWITGRQPPTTTTILLLPTYPHQLGRSQRPTPTPHQHLLLFLLPLLCLERMNRYGCLGRSWRKWRS